MDPHSSTGLGLQRWRRVPPARWAGLLLLLLLLAGASAALLRTPIRGLADNSDYWRLARPRGIQTLPHANVEHVQRWHPWVTEMEEDPPWVTSVALLLDPVRLAQAALGSTSFDLYPLGLTYLALFLLAVGLGLRGGIPLGLLVLVVWRSVDTPMLVHYHSLYVETPVWLGLLALVGSFYTAPDLTRWSLARTLCVTALSLFVGFSKHAYAIVPLCVALAAWWAYERAGAGTWRRVVPRLLMLSLVAIYALNWAARPSDFHHKTVNINNAVNGVTTGLFVVSSDPAAAAARLGLPPESIQLRGKSAFDPELKQPELTEAVRALQASSKLALALEYVRDPGAAVGALQEFTRRIPDATRTLFGNFERGDGPPLGQFHVAWEWSAWAGRLFNSSGVLFWGVLVLAAALVLASRHEGWWARCRERLAGARAAAVFLLLVVILQIPIIIIGDGFFDFVRHVHQLRACSDVLAILLAYVGVTELLRVLRRHPHKESL
jgi:hypothetical protein